MKRTQQLINNDGLQIPLPLMLQYGLYPGASVTVELDDDIIRIVPKLPDQSEIENRSLQLLLKSVGDGVLIKATQLEIAESERQAGDWRVHISARGIDEVLGYLDYNKYGELLSHIPTVVDTVFENAAVLGESS